MELDPLQNLSSTVSFFSLSCQSKSAKQRGEYMEARTKSQWSLWLNVSALISYLALMILGVGLLLVVLLTF